MRRNLWTTCGGNITYTFVEITGTFFECFLVFFYLYNLFHKKRGWAVITLSYILFTTIFCVLSFLPVLPLIRLVALCLCAFGFSVTLFDAKLLWGLFATFLLCAITIVSDLLCMGIMNALGWDNSSIMNAGVQRAVYIVFAKIVFLVSILLVTAFLHREQAPINVWRILPLLPCQIVSIYYCDSLFRAELIALSAKSLIIILGLLYINIVVVVYGEAIRVQAQLRHEKELAKEQYEIQRMYYDKMYHQREETRSMWHDIKKYMIAMQSMVSISNKEATEQVLDVAQRKFNQIGNVVDTNNRELDAILDYNIQNAQNEDIEVTMDVWVHEKLRISAVDLSILLGNTFDNAIEACQAIPPAERKISVLIKQKQDVVFYEISNPYSTTVKARKKKIHGYGLQNIQACINHYGGVMSTKSENGIFTVSIHMNDIAPAELESTGLQISN